LGCELLADRDHEVKAVVVVKGSLAVGENEAHLGAVQGAFRVYSGNIQGTCREHSGTTKSKPLLLSKAQSPSERMMHTWTLGSGNIEGTFREHSGNTEGKFGEHSRKF
jgi:hypothetical protein